MDSLHCPEQNTPLRPHTPGTVLVVDAEPLLLGILESSLTKAGLPTKTFTNPLAALEWYRSNHHGVGLVVFDDNLPALAAHEFLSNCLSISPTKKIAALSSSNDPSIIAELLEQGAVSYFAKPLDYESVTLWALQECEPQDLEPGEYRDYPKT